MSKIQCWNIETFSLPNQDTKQVKTLFVAKMRFCSNMTIVVKVI